MNVYKNSLCKKKKGIQKMDIWNVINGLIYLLAFGLIAWVLLDASRISKRRG